MDTSPGAVDDTTQDQAEPSEHDIQEFAQRLRSAPAEGVLVEVFSTLLSTAQIKLGRPDARLFIDLCGAMLEQAGGQLSEGLRGQVEAALGQLRLGQVSAETEAAKRAETEPDDLAEAPSPPPTGGQAETTTADPSAAPSSPLWTPGH